MAKDGAGSEAGACELKSADVRKVTDSRTPPRSAADPQDT